MTEQNYTTTKLLTQHFPGFVVKDTLATALLTHIVQNCRLYTVYNSCDDDTVEYGDHNYSYIVLA